MIDADELNTIGHQCCTCMGLLIVAGADPVTAMKTLAMDMLLAGVYFERARQGKL
jgi:hypothetical protein